jgi:hypothetical protein
MARFLHIFGGVVANIVEYGTQTPPPVSDTGAVIVPDPGGILLGSDFDVTDTLKDRLCDSIEQQVISKEFFRLTNEVRVLQGLSVWSAAQYRAFIKSRIT